MVVFVPLLHHHASPLVWDNVLYVEYIKIVITTLIKWSLFPQYGTLVRKAF